MFNLGGNGGPLHPWSQLYAVKAITEPNRIKYARATHERSETAAK